MIKREGSKNADGTQKGTGEPRSTDGDTPREESTTTDRGDVTSSRKETREPGTAGTIQKRVDALRTPDRRQKRTAPVRKQQTLSSPGKKATPRRRRTDEHSRDREAKTVEATAPQVEPAPTSESTNHSPAVAEQKTPGPSAPTSTTAPLTQLSNGNTEVAKDNMQPADESHSPQEWLTEWDRHLFNEGTHHRLYEKLGAHHRVEEGADVTHFAVWAPSARYVAVVGDFNSWDDSAHPLEVQGESGVWYGKLPDVAKGTLYKFFIESIYDHYEVAKTDPYGYLQQVPPETASVVWDLDYTWNDSKWMSERREKHDLRQPISIYEVHLGSWRRVTEENNRSLTYREIAAPLADYVKKLGFTHVEFLPLMEHPFYGSWGYQSTGYFAPTSRYGTPQDLMYLIDYLHQQQIGVIFDWVPSHFPTDEHALGFFDGTHLYEHADPRQGFHPDWSSFIFNYGRPEVRSFLISSALFWLEKYHVDGIRVDAVASMLYLDYSRKNDEWIPNEYGGRDNLEALHFLRRLNEDIQKVCPDVLMIAEESTAWPMVSRPTYLGGLGFQMKWDMGWMHDTLRYFSHEPVFRKFHHNELTFRSIYAYSENFLLPLSHDEVVHGKGSLIRKMQGDEWQRFANLRLLFSYMYAQPAKKLLFMGGEFGQWREWNHDASLDWDLLDEPFHQGVGRVVADLNRIYRDNPAMNELDVEPAGFEWLDANDSEQSVLSFIRHDKTGQQAVVALFNFTPIVRHNYRIGVSESGMWREIFNSDAAEYGGSGVGNLGELETAPISSHARRYSLNVTLPPLAAIFLVHSGSAPE